MASQDEDLQTSVKDVLLLKINNAFQANTLSAVDSEKLKRTVINSKAHDLLKTIRGNDSELFNKLNIKEILEQLEPRKKDFGGTGPNQKGPDARSFTDVGTNMGATFVKRKESQMQKTETEECKALIEILKDYIKEKEEEVKKLEEKLKQLESRDGQASDSATAQNQTGSAPDKNTQGQNKDPKATLDGHTTDSATDGKTQKQTGKSHDTSNSKPGQNATQDGKKHDSPAVESPKKEKEKSANRSKTDPRTARTEQSRDSSSAEKSHRDIEKTSEKKAKLDPNAVVEQLENYLRQQSDEISQLKDEEKAMDKRLSESTERANDIERQLNTLHQQNVDLNKKNSKLNDDFKQMTDMKNSAKQELDTLMDQYKELKIQNESEREKSNKLSKAYEKLSREKEHEIKRFEEEMKAKSKEMDKLKKEKDDYRDRFSKMAGDKLTEKNADIADLSDPNRAMKLAEKFSGLYDDDWTDAYTTLQEKKMSVKDATQLLLRILKSCYDTCEYIAGKQLEQLTTILLYPVQTERKPAIRDQAGIKVKEPRLGSKNERILRDARRQMWEASIDFVRQALFEQTKEWMDKEIGPTVFEDIKAYIEKCVEVCWLMIVHEPPVYPKTEITDEKMDPNIYTAFSASGKKIEYLVWPPLYNGKGGGLLSKGVVELVKPETKDGGKKK